MRFKKQGMKPIDQPNFRYWQALYMALYSSRFYVDVIKRWRGFGVLYFVFLTALCSIPVAIQGYQLASIYFKNELIYPIKHMPLLMIKDGQVSMNEPSPYIGKSRTGKNVVKIDLNGTTRDFSKESPSLILLITKDTIIYRMSLNNPLPGFKESQLNDEIKPYTFDSKDNEVFSGREWVKFSKVKYLNLILALFIYPCTVGALLGIYGSLNLVISSIGRIISTAILKHTIHYKVSFRLAWVASTGPFIFMMLIYSSGVNVINSGIYYLVLVCCYFCYGVLCVKRESNQLVLA